MKEKIVWFRVTDPLSPLFGCDVKVDEGFDWTVIRALRRVDITVGDRPFQLTAPEGEHLGLMIDARQLEASPVQEDVVELTRESPYGSFICERTYRGTDGLTTLTVVRYERALQAALSDGKSLLGNNTWLSDRPDDLSELEGELGEMLGTDTEKLVTFMRTGSDGQ